jgi:hypothetical protein
MFYLLVQQIFGVEQLAASGEAYGTRWDRSEVR